MKRDAGIAHTTRTRHSGRTCRVTKAHGTCVITRVVPHDGVMCGGTCGARRRHRSCHTHGYSGRREVTSAHGASSHASSHTTKSRAAVDEKRDASVVHATSAILAGYTCGVTSAHGASSRVSAKASRKRNMGRHTCRATREATRVVTLAHGAPRVVASRMLHVKRDEGIVLSTCRRHYMRTCRITLQHTGRRHTSMGAE